MRKLSIATLTAASISVAISGCATEEYVNNQVASVNKRMDSQHTEMAGKLDKQAQDAQAQEGRLNTSIAGVSRTAQEALDRANSAGKLAEGKFMFETVLSGHIAFALDNSKLTPEAKKSLDVLIAQLKADNKNVYLEIQGHTDSSGSDDANLRLAQKRADAVHRYLAITGGIALHRMAVMSYGESAPIADNKTHAGRVENRRVAVVVLQ